LAGILILVGAVSWVAVNRFYGFFSVVWDEAFLGCMARSILDGELPSWRAYRGPWEFYSAVPFIRACADPVRALALHAYFWTTAGACAAAWLTHALSRRHLAALLCGLAVAVSPGIVMGAQRGVVWSGVPLLPLCALALGTLVQASRGSRAAWLASCLLAGLSVGFAPQGMGFFAAWLTCVYWLRRELSPLLRGRSLAYGGLLLAVGPAPLVLERCILWRRTGELLLGSLSVTPMGVRNADYASNLFERLVQWRDVWTIPRMPPPIWVRSAWQGGFAVCAVLQLWAAVSMRKGGGADRALFLPLYAVLCVLALSPLTLASLRPEHLLYLLPLAFTAVAVTPSCWEGHRKPASAAVLASLAACVLGGLTSWRVVDRALRDPYSDKREGGARSRDLVFHAQWVLRQKPRSIFCLSRFPPSDIAFRYLTAGEPPSERPTVVPVDCMGLARLDGDDGKGPVFREAADGDYLVHTRSPIGGCPQVTSRDLQAMAAASGKSLVRKTKEVYPGGSMFHEIYRIGKKRVKGAP